MTQWGLSPVMKTPVLFSMFANGIMVYGNLDDEDRGRSWV
jgi:hypothetical protein